MISKQVTNEFPSDWHVLTLMVPINDPNQAQIIINSISADKPIKSPSLIRRQIELISTLSNHVIEFKIAALTLRQARVSMDHFINDLDLVIETLLTFSS
ncbi:hypothetical protein DFH28DRAFT_968704 [Melampsora americana]|nr:hypothetical protein DFH28DRAFT_968704 [Melampsora americana]